MKQFHEQSWDVRFTKMGDEAEGLFALLHPNSAPFGLRRPPVNLTNVPLFIRYMPDFLLHNRLVEVMGVGQDQLLKLKVEKHDVLLDWDVLHPTSLFIWDSHKRRHIELSITDFNPIMSLCQKRQFPEGKEYYEIPLDVLPGEWSWLPPT